MARKTSFSINTPGEKELTRKSETCVFYDVVSADVNRKGVDKGQGKNAILNLSEELSSWYIRL
jgi:hypothetical protein